MVSFGHMVLYVSLYRLHITTNPIHTLIEGERRYVDHDRKVSNLGWKEQLVSVVAKSSNT